MVDLAGRLVRSGNTCRRATRSKYESITIRRSGPSSGWCEASVATPKPEYETPINTSVPPSPSDRGDELGESGEIGGLTPVEMAAARGPGLTY